MYCLEYSLKGSKLIFSFIYSQRKLYYYKGKDSANKIRTGGLENYLGNFLSDCFFKD